MFRWRIIFVAAASIIGVNVSAQVPARPIDPVFVRAQELVSDGNGAAGRALVDSVLKANSPTSQIYPQALYWRASLAANAADAESDYKHIVVDYPLAPQAEDALLRLAQLELARGDKEGALAHLQRIPRDYPRSRSLARASYWMARVFFEKNDIANACAANANALAQVGTGEVELQNQIQYQGQRCASFNATRLTAEATVPPPATASSTVSSVPVTNGAISNTPASASSTSPVVDRNTATKTPVEDSTTTRRAAPTAQVARPKPPPEARDVRPSIVDPAKARTISVANDAAKKAASGAAYSVQVAAYTKRADAEKLVSSLVKRGYQARVDGNTAPFRVRIGRYPSEREAEAALSRIKAKQMEGFVVRAPER